MFQYDLLSGIPIVDIHEFDQVSIGNIAHALRLAALSRPCVLWLPDLDLLFPRQIDPVSSFRGKCLPMCIRLGISQLNEMHHVFSVSFL